MRRWSVGRSYVPGMRVRYADVAAACGALYGLAHLLWSWGDAPQFVRTESVLEEAWIGAVPALVASSGYVALRRGGGQRWTRWAALCAAWSGCLGLAAYCLLLWPTLAQLLTVPFGAPITLTELAAIGLRFAGTASAVGIAAAVLPEFRSLRGVCPDCGRHHTVPLRDERYRLLGFLGAYLALACWAVRMVLAVRTWIADGGIGGPDGFIVFVALLVAAGTILPLALAHSWGRIWPHWVGPLAGRRVPRWLVLGPGVMMSLGLGVYFGIGGVTALILGETGGALEILAYLGWGVGLGIASYSYARRTRQARSLGGVALSRGGRSHG